MDDNEYKRLLAAYEADKQKEKEQTQLKQKQTNLKTQQNSNHYFDNNYKKSQEEEIWELKRKLADYENRENKPVRPTSSGSKAGIGFVCAFFLGVIGLIIGLLLYRDDDYARSTFLKGWAWTFGTIIVLCLVCGLIAYLVAINYANDIINNIYG